jgi:hypothetical protein
VQSTVILSVKLFVFSCFQPTAGCKSIFFWPGRENRLLTSVSSKETLWDEPVDRCDTGWQQCVNARAEDPRTQVELLGCKKKVRIHRISRPSAPNLILSRPIKGGFSCTNYFQVIELVRRSHSLLPRDRSLRRGSVARTYPRQAEVSICV